MDLYCSVAKACLWVYQRATFQRRCVIGKDRLPPGAKIVAANHPNPTDAYHFPFVLKGKFYALIAGTSFSLPVAGWLMRRCGQIPVHKGQKHKALEQACEFLRRGQTVLIFPEGRLNPDHLPIKAGTGAVRMSLISEAPIVPVGIYVPEKCLHTRHAPCDGRIDKRRYQVGGCCYIQIGEPWYPARESGAQGQAYSPRELTAILMEKIDALAYQARQAALLSDGQNYPAMAVQESKSEESVIMLEPQPDLSVIIVSWNVRKLLDECLSPPEGGHDLHRQNTLRRRLWNTEIYLKSLRG